MAWLLIKLMAPSDTADAVADALSAAGAMSVSIESATDEQRLQAAGEATPLWNENRITGVFPEDADTTPIIAAARTVMASEVLSYEIDRLEDTDWERAWMADYRPQQVGTRLWITPSWCEPPDSTATNVVLDPGLAFGTGTHPTTRLCLEWLAELPLAGANVIDYGCGSGVLAIAALKLGAARASGIDIEPQALAVSRANAERNGVADRFVALTPDELAPGATADLVIANILSEILVTLAPELAGYVRPGGYLGLSGILLDQVENVRAAYPSNVDFALTTRADWALLTGRRHT